MRRFVLGVLVGALLAGLAAARVTESLSRPVVHPYSFELLANSRYSVHAGFSDTLPAQVMANVLWAMSRAPGLGGYRELYVATAQNVYRHDSEAGVLAVHLSGDHRYNSGSAFEVGIAVEKHEEAGFVVQAGLLAGTAFRDKSSGSVVSCPMKWAADHANAEWRPAHPVLMAAAFGRAEAEVLDTTCVAQSSDSSLPMPYTVGQDTFEQVLAGLRQDSSFGPAELSLETISQLCWACYGVTPHLSYNGRQGTTVPTASASYQLTRRIYVVGSDGLDRYHNRLPPGSSPTTRDHRLERVAANDCRLELGRASGRIPSGAPLHFVICVGDTGSYAAMEEVGFAGFQLLMQARALGLGGCLTAPLSRKERDAISAALGLPPGDVPALVFSCGQLPAALDESAMEPAQVKIVRAQPAIRRGQLRLEYFLAQAGPVRVEVFDMLGRPVRLLRDESQTPGYHSVTWDGTDPDGRRLKRGTYLVVVFSRGAVARHKVQLG